MAVITKEVNVGDVTAVPTVHVAGGLGRRQRKAHDLEPTGGKSARVPASLHLPSLGCAPLRSTLHSSGGTQTQPLGDRQGQGTVLGGQIQSQRCQRWRVRGVLLKEGQEREGPGGAEVLAQRRGAVVEGRGVGRTKEATGIAEPGRKAWRAGGAPEVLKGSGDRARSAPVMGGTHAWTFLRKCQTHPTRGETCEEQPLP